MSDHHVVPRDELVSNFMKNPTVNSFDSEYPSKKKLKTVRLHPESLHINCGCLDLFFIGLFCASLLECCLFGFLENVVPIIALDQIVEPGEKDRCAVQLIQGLTALAVSLLQLRNPQFFHQPISQPSSPA
jgi:hypothetical protein